MPRSKTDKVKKPEKPETPARVLPKKLGRPSIFSQELADRICERLCNGESLRSICDDKDMPGLTTVFRWLQNNESFREFYTRARETQADALFDELLNIADDGRNDWMERQLPDKTKGWQENGEAIRRSALRVDARKWIVSKLLPRKYSDKAQVELTGAGGGPVQVQALTIDARDLMPEHREALKQALLAAKNAKGEK